MVRSFIKKNIKSYESHKYFKCYLFKDISIYETS